jgi:bifunctional DNase/RNase
LVLTPDGGPEVTVSSRPSDAVAIALRASCPIFVLDDLIDLVGEVIEEDESRTDTGIIDEFRDFIENISPEDFDT